MKVDLTSLPRSEQIAAVGGYMILRTKAVVGNHAELYASDLAEKFKHRGLTTNKARVDFFNGIMREVIQEAKARTPEGIAAKIVADAQQCPTP